MSVIRGTVTEIDKRFRSGTIRDFKGREYHFHENECESGSLPSLHSTVTFLKDRDFKSTNVACLVKVHQSGLPE